MFRSIYFSIAVLQYLYILKPNPFLCNTTVWRIEQH